MIPIITPAEMAAIDAAAPMPVAALVERAGAAAARAAVDLLGGTYRRRVAVIAGKGNNGADGRAAATRELAASIGAVVVHKGPTTIVAYPDGPALVVANGGPALATTGTGDVLAGAVTALLAQGVDPVRAAASAAWLRAEAGCEQVGLVARGLPDWLGLLLTDG